MLNFVHALSINVYICPQSWLECSPFLKSVPTLKSAPQNKGPLHNLVNCTLFLPVLLLTTQYIHTHTLSKKMHLRASIKKCWPTELCHGGLYMPFGLASIQSNLFLWRHMAEAPCISQDDDAFKWDTIVNFTSFRANGMWSVSIAADHLLNRSDNP